MIPPIQDRDPPRARLPGAPPRLQHGVPVTKSRRHPTSVDVVTIAELPFLEKPKTGEPPSPPAAQQPEETDSPQSPLPDEEGRWISNLTNKRCWCSSPSRRGRRPVCGGLLARNPQVGSASLLTRRTSVVTVSDDGSDPNGASTSLGR